MYCAKCGEENPDEGRFCRKCGTALVPPDNLKDFVLEDWVQSKLAPLFPGDHKDSRQSGGGWGSAMVTLFLGIALTIISFVLAFQPMGIGWWFLLLIPSFVLMGIGVAKTIKLEKRTERPKKKDSWESAMGTLFSGIAFTILTFVLAFQPMGRGWWFWLLIPAFSMIGSGIAQSIRMNQRHKDMDAGIVSSTGEDELASGEPSALPPKRTTPAVEEADSRYKTGDLTPTSVTEGTTRHLSADPEGETMTLPEEKPE